MKLYGYFRSSAAYRVRLALHIKGVPYEEQTVHLVKDGGQQHSTEYHKLNPQGLVPTLEDGGLVLSQSMAILEYLEEQYPQVSILPQNAMMKAQARAFAQTIACDIHPLDNLRVLKYLTETLEVDEPQKQQWYHHWILKGFHALEITLNNHPKTPFCFGEKASIADICLIPQMYNAYRFECPMLDFPRLEEIYQHCMSLPAFQEAAPEAQPDYPA